MVTAQPSLGAHWLCSVSVSPSLHPPSSRANSYKGIYRPSVCQGSPLLQHLWRACACIIQPGPRLSTWQHIQGPRSAKGDAVSSAGSFWFQDPEFPWPGIIPGASEPSLLYYSRGAGELRGTQTLVLIKTSVLLSSKDTHFLCAGCLCLPQIWLLITRPFWLCPYLSGPPPTAKSWGHLPLPPLALVSLFQPLILGHPNNISAQRRAERDVVAGTQLQGTPPSHCWFFPTHPAWACSCLWIGGNYAAWNGEAG